LDAAGDGAGEYLRQADHMGYTALHRSVRRRKGRGGGGKNCGWIESGSSVVLQGACCERTPSRCGLNPKRHHTRACGCSACPPRGERARPKARPAEPEQARN
jgi:hypothetical protein